MVFSVVVLMFVLLLLFFFLALYAGLWAIMYVIFATHFVGLLPLSLQGFDALLYNHGGFLPSRLSGRVLMC